MRAPAFWFEERGAPAQFLRPFAALYGAIAARRMAREGEPAPVPVVTIGNFGAGGAGKTPAVIAIAEALIADGLRPAVLSRGYGGRASRGPPLRVTDHNAAEVGDEPLLLARVAPTYIGADRVAAGSMAARADASVLVLDDGLQSRRLEPDLAIALVDSQSGVGNGLVMPAGPLRAPLGAQLRHIHAVVVVGGGAGANYVLEQTKQMGVAVFRAEIGAENAGAWRGRRVVAFAGIARPEKFFATLESIGAAVVARHGFADHHPYSAAEIDRLRLSARRMTADLVTTEKDFVRLSSKERQGVEALPVKMRFEPAFGRFLKDRLVRPR